VATPGGCSGKCSRAWPRREREFAAMSQGSRARRGRGGGMAWGMARSSGGAARQGLGSARSAGAHARARVLASQGRGVAVPSARHRHLGPAARHGGEGAMAAAGCRDGATGSGTKRWHGGRMGEGVLGLVTEGSSAARGSRRQQRDREAVVLLTGGAEGDGAWGGGEAVPWRGGAGPGSAGSSV
jgi:hypothetical protein